MVILTILAWIPVLITQLDTRRSPAASVQRTGSSSELPAGPAQLTPYQKEQRLRAIDQIYDVFTEQLSPAYVEGRDLFGRLLLYVGDGTAEEKLTNHAKRVETAFSNLSALLKRYEYFSDIVEIPQRKPGFNGLNEINASRNLISEIELLKKAVEPNYFSQFLDRDMILFEARNANREFEQFLQAKMPLLQKKREEIESTKAVGDTK
jgi:hypothetical protein